MQRIFYLYEMRDFVILFYVSSFLLLRCLLRWAYLDCNFSLAHVLTTKGVLGGFAMTDSILISEHWKWLWQKKDEWHDHLFNYSNFYYPLNNDGAHCTELSGSIELSTVRLMMSITTWNAFFYRGRN